MKLVHYSDGPLGKLRAMRQPRRLHEFVKPRGLWLSADDHEQNWRDWCLSEGYCRHKLTHVHDVRLKPKAPVLFVRGVGAIDRFTRDYGQGLPGRSERVVAIDWRRVAEAYQGIVIAPYLWERRLGHMPSCWYYGWDCASGCIWDPAAIASVRLREVVPVPEREGQAA